MKKAFLKFSLVIFTAIVALSACKTTDQDHIYMQDVTAGHPYNFNHHDPVVHPGDKLNITVSCKNPELAVPFNSNGGVVTMSTNGTIGGTEAQARAASYTVDTQGYIEFPILGQLHVEGMTQKDVQEMIKSRIVEGKYINNPLVSMEFLNFKYTVLGAVGHTGQFSSENGRVTILEAIAAAGDLASNADSKQVLVYREENGHQVMYGHDLTNSSFLNSPCYFLQQNDLVYVVPKTKVKDSEGKAFRRASLLISMTSALSSVLYVVLAITNK